MINVLRHQFAGTEPTFEDYQAAIEKEATAFVCLFNKTDVFEIDYPQYTADDVLDLMEYFHHIKPLAIKSGDQVFLCTCCDAYQKYCCVESTILSLLYNLELEVPDIERLKQIKEREKLVLANPFNAKRIKDQKQKEAKAKEKAVPKWKPHMPVYASCAPGSAADMATQRGKLTSRTVMPAAAQVPTSAVDPLQMPVDPKLLVTSGAKGPPARRQRPAKVHKQTKVLCVHLLSRLYLTHSTYPSSLPGRLPHHSRFNSRSSAARDLPCALRPSPRPPGRRRRRKTLRGKLPF
jgi:hypothetical protein